MKKESFRFVLFLCCAIAGLAAGIALTPILARYDLFAATERGVRGYLQTLYPWIRLQLILLCGGFTAYAFVFAAVGAVCGGGLLGCMFRRAAVCSTWSAWSAAVLLAAASAALVLYCVAALSRRVCEAAPGDGVIRRLPGQWLLRFFALTGMLDLLLLIQWLLFQ